jgi:putative phage-type endonuclease
MSGVAKSPEWHARRARTVGSSEIAALFDCAPPYALSRYALWHVKAGLVAPPVVENERVRWGCMLEEAIAEAVREERGWKVEQGFFATDPVQPGMSCTLDFVVREAEGFDGPGVLETKNVDFVQHRRAWTSGEPPPHILLQLQHQLACTGLRWGAVAGLVGGNRLEVYPYVVRPKLVIEIRRRVDAFWRSIEQNRPPPVDGSDGASDVLRALHPDVVDEAADMRGNNEWSEAVAEFIVAGERKREAEQEYSAAKNRVAELIGPHKRAWGNGYSVTVAVTPEKPSRPAREGETIPGRSETRRYMAKMEEAA